MFLLEDVQVARKNERSDKARRGDTLIAVLFSAAVIFYVILSLLSVRHTSVSPVTGSQTVYQVTAPTVEAAITASR